MNVHLKASSNRYSDKDKGFLINPISTLDAQIIEELIVFTKKVNLTVLSDILEDYKLDKDTDTLDKLRDLNSTTQSKGEDGGEGAKLLSKILSGIKLHKYIKIAGKRINLSLIYGYDSEDIDRDGKLIYLIILNPVPDNTKQVPLYANCTFSFLKAEERDKVLEVLDSNFEQNKGEFLNEK